MKYTTSREQGVAFLSPPSWATIDAAASLRAQLPPPLPGLRACIIIPAKNEAAHLPVALAALARQTDLRGQPWPPASLEVLVLANNCDDATAAVVRQQAQLFPHLPLHLGELWLSPAQAHVGCARRLLMDEACARLEAVGQPGGLIMSTDADTEVAPDWLAATQAALAAGAEAVGGRIVTQLATMDKLVRRTQLRDTAYHLLCARLESRLDPAPADPWPRHHQHFGASLALTARAYRRVGGLPDVRFLEDEALWQALRRHDVPVRHSPAVRVVTSGRQEGRVEVGLSWQLRQWVAMHHQQCEPLVDCPTQLAALWRARRQLRAAWAKGFAPLTWAECERLATQLRVPASDLEGQLRADTTFGRVWEWLMQKRAATGSVCPQVPLSQAVPLLRQLLQEGGD